MTYHCHAEHGLKQWRRLHRAPGHREQKNNKQETGQTVLTITKALTKKTALSDQNSGGAGPKKIQLRTGVTGHKPGASRVKAETILPFRPTDRGFSKLALVKSKLSSTMGQHSTVT